MRKVQKVHFEPQLTLLPEFTKIRTQFKIVLTSV